MKLLLPALVIALASPQAAPSDVLLLKGGRIVSLAGAEIDAGMVLVEKGRIRSVGETIDAPAGAQVLEVPRGSWIVPGFVDAHSHLGSAFDVEESTESWTPEARAVDAFTSRHSEVQAALGSGVTTVALAPGNGNLLGGRVGVVKLNGQRYDRALRLVSAGFKASLGAEALRPDREPTSRTGAVAMFRDRLRDPKSELRSQPLFVHVNSAGEIESAFELQSAFGLKMTLVHARQAGEIVERVAAGKLPVAFGALTVSERRDVLETPGRLARAGVPVAFVSDAPATPEEQLRVSAAFAVKYGMERESALRALTTVPAELLGLSKECGTISEGKAADLVVWSGDPLALGSEVELVLVDGRVTWKKGKP
jgi:imidazolonepropionase-like amidohydrolase